MLRAVHQGDCPRHAHQPVSQDLSVSLRWQRMVWLDCRAASGRAVSADSCDAFHARQADDGEAHLTPSRLNIRTHISIPTYFQNYLGEIELLTRGQFTSQAPVLYKIRFPKHNFPPKLMLISANNQVICFGSAGRSYM